MNKANNFKNMHFGDKALFLPNAWDTLSAIILEQTGFKAIGTTSWGISNSHGYTDGEKISFDNLLTVTEGIINAVSIPVSIDIETGYAEEKQAVADNILKIAELGAAGINIEDSFKDKPGLKTISKHAALLTSIRAQLDANGFEEFYINARTDTYFQLEKPLAETIERSTAYVNAGASGIFVPGVQRNEDVKAIVDTVAAPVNILSLPGLTNIEALEAIGVKRFSIGNALSDATIAFIEGAAKDMFENRDTTKLYEGTKVETTFK